MLQVGKMTQLNIDKIFVCNDTAQEITIDRELLRPLLVEHRIGSLLNSPYAGNGWFCGLSTPSHLPTHPTRDSRSVGLSGSSPGDYGWTASQWRRAIQVIQVRH